MPAQPVERPIEGPQQPHARSRRIHHHAAGTAPFETKVHEPDAARQPLGNRRDLAIVGIAGISRPQAGHRIETGNQLGAVLSAPEADDLRRPRRITLEQRYGPAVTDIDERDVRERWGGAVGCHEGG